MSEENNNQENEDEFLRAALGDLENDPAHEAWIMMHEMYLSLQKGGFKSSEAIEIVVSYLIKIMKGEGL